MALNCHGGQPSLFLQVVNTPLVIVDVLSSIITLLPFNLKSLSTNELLRLALTSFPKTFPDLVFINAKEVLNEFFCLSTEIKLLTLIKF